MDIAGAKALKQRLGPNGGDEAVPTSGTVDVPADAPPVYHWTGVSKPAAPAPESAEDDGLDASAASLFRRLVPSFR